MPHSLRSVPWLLLAVTHPCPRLPQVWAPAPSTAPFTPRVSAAKAAPPSSHCWQTPGSGAGAAQAFQQQTLPIDRSVKPHAGPQNPRSSIPRAIKDGMESDLCRIPVPDGFLELLVGSPGRGMIGCFAEGMQLELGPTCSESHCRVLSCSEAGFRVKCMASSGPAGSLVQKAFRVPGLHTRPCERPWRSRDARDMIPPSGSSQSGEDQGNRQTVTTWRSVLRQGESS